jgi:hypothetical protein
LKNLGYSDEEQKKMMYYNVAIKKRLEEKKYNSKEIEKKADEYMKIMRALDIEKAKPQTTEVKKSTQGFMIDYPYDVDYITRCQYEEFMMMGGDPDEFLNYY